MEVSSTLVSILANPNHLFRMNVVRFFNFKDTLLSFRS